MLRRTLIDRSLKIIEILKKHLIFPFYVDTEIINFGEEEIVYWDFKIPKVPCFEFRRDKNNEYFCIYDWKEKRVEYFKFEYPNFYTTYPDYYYVSLVVYGRFIEKKKQWKVDYLENEK